MVKRKSTVIFAAIAASIPISLSAVSASAAEVGASADFGQLVQGTFVDRQVIIRPDTKWANVTDGETVRFVVKAADGQDQSFIWHFETNAAHGSAVDLSKIAPPSVVLEQPVQVYLAPNVSERS